MSRIHKFFLITTIIFSPTIAYANGGLPIIFLINTYAFIVGTIFVLIIENMYLKKIFIDVPSKELLFCVIKFNLWSGLFGATAIPILMLIIQLEPIVYLIKSDTKESTMTFIWWASFSVDLFLAYIASVFIEYMVLKRASFAIRHGDNRALLGHVVKFNLASYFALFLIVILTIFLMN